MAFTGIIDPDASHQAGGVHILAWRRALKCCTFSTADHYCLQIQMKFIAEIFKNNTYKYKKL
jgi:hypothetical protein